MNVSLHLAQLIIHIMNFHVVHTCIHIQWVYMFCLESGDGSSVQSVDMHLYFINPATDDTVPAAALFISVSRAQFV